jgi:thymidylate synthase
MEKNMLNLKVADIREEFKHKLAIEEFVTDKTGVKTLEIIGANFIADEESIFGEVNKDYVQREIDWYLTQSLSIYDMKEPVPKIWKEIANEKEFINSNYGWCIWHEDNYKQYDNVIKELRANNDSRRGIMIYNRPGMWLDWNHDGMNDFMCTNAVQYLVRNDRVNAVVQMRSNDVVFGYKNDWAWQALILDMVSRDLNKKRGDIIWNVGSLHVYERHFDLVK